MLSKFEDGFKLFVETERDQKNLSKRTVTRRVNKAIRLMASEDFGLMKKIVVNEWMINRALSK